MQSNNFIPFDESDEYINEINRKYAHREVKNAKESERFLNEVCRYCNVYPRCIETERFYASNKQVRRICLMLSSPLKQYWIDVSERRRKFNLYMQYGRLTPICYFKKRKGRWYILCKCECGNFIVVRQNNLLTGNTKSCGCITKSIESNTILSRTSYNIYEGGYAENPDRASATEETYPTRKFRMPSSAVAEYSSPVGKSVWTSIEVQNNSDVKYVWTVLRCDECGGVVRLDEHLIPVCERCGLVSVHKVFYDENGQIII